MIGLGVIGSINWTKFLTTYFICGLMDLGLCCAWAWVENRVYLKQFDIVKLGSFV